MGLSLIYFLYEYDHWSYKNCTVAEVGTLINHIQSTCLFSKVQIPKFVYICKCAAFIGGVDLKSKGYLHKYTYIPLIGSSYTVGIGGSVGVVNSVKSKYLYSPWSTSRALHIYFIEGRCFALNRFLIVKHLLEGSPQLRFW